MSTPMSPFDRECVIAHAAYCAALGGDTPCSFEEALNAEGKLREIAALDLGPPNPLAMQERLAQVAQIVEQASIPPRAGFGLSENLAILPDHGKAEITRSTTGGDSAP